MGRTLSSSSSIDIADLLAAALSMINPATDVLGLFAFSSAMMSVHLPFM
jgi:hypothetical protein